MDVKLNVWSPSNATRLLPVYVFIHGGCYGAGSGQQDQTPLLYTNKNAFVAVTIQYRVCSFRLFFPLRVCELIGLSWAPLASWQATTFTGEAQSMPAF